MPRKTPRVCLRAVSSGAFMLLVYKHGFWHHFSLRCCWAPAVRSPTSSSALWPALGSHQQPHQPARCSRPEEFCKQWPEKPGGRCVLIQAGVNIPTEASSLLLVVGPARARQSWTSFRHQTSYGPTESLIDAGSFSPAHNSLSKGSKKNRLEDRMMVLAARIATQDGYRLDHMFAWPGSTILPVEKLSPTRQVLPSSRPGLACCHL